VRRTEDLLELLDPDVSPHVLLERLAALDLAGCTVEEWYDLDIVRMNAGNKVSNHTLDIDVRLAWADLALRCIELIVATTPVDQPGFPLVFPPPTDARDHWARQFKRTKMMLRANMIASLGPIDVRGESRDPEAIADWFLASVHGESAESVLAELPTPLIDLGIDRIRELRAIKNNLAVVVLMLGHGPVPVAPPRDVLLLQWIALRDQLP